MTNGSAIRIVLAAGGTGGHIYPARALAEVLLARGCDVTLITDHRGGAFDDALPAVTVHRIQAGAPSGRGFWGKLDGVGRILAGLRQARKLLARIRPAAVVGFGSYASIPTMIAARQKGFDSLLHEQNAVLGRANRMLARRVGHIATGFPNIRGLPAGVSAKLSRTGNPIRPEIGALAGRPYQAPAQGETLSLLVLGGSQGARALSQLVPAAIAALPAELQARLDISQQARPEDLDETRAAYADCPAKVEVSSFFTDVPERMGRAHLAVCRAGASTVSELTAAGVPAILVPYPYATDDHQFVNASQVADAGGAWVMREEDLDAGKLADRIGALAGDPDALTAAAKAASDFGMPDAAERLADLVMGVATGKGAPADIADASVGAAA